MGRTPRKEPDLEQINGKARETGARLARAFARVSHMCVRIDRFIYTKRLLVLALCFIVMVLTMAAKYRVFSPDAFTDARFVLERAVSGQTADTDTSYTATIRFFGLLTRLTGVKNIVAWSWILLFPGAAMALFVLYKARPQSVTALFVALCLSVLLPFYVFMPGKDFLQYSVFFLIALVLIYVKKEWMKACVSAVLLIPVALLFRNYYVLMIALIAAFYCFALVYRNMLTAMSRSVCLMCTMLLVVFAFYLVRGLFPYQAQSLFTIRSVVNHNLGRDAMSDKVILDLLPLEQSVPGFLGNYLFASIRMALPFELMTDPGDIPFTVFQLALTGLLVAELVRSRRVQARTAVYAVTLAFFFMSFIFEPDFASWFRHETAAFPIIWLALGADKKTMRGVNMEASDGI